MAELKMAVEVYKAGFKHGFTLPNGLGFISLCQKKLKKKLIS
jgi:hypothetical protein